MTPAEFSDFVPQEREKWGRWSRRAAPRWSDGRTTGGLTEEGGTLS